MSNYLDSAKTNHSINLGYYYLMDSYSTQENNLKMEGRIKGFYGSGQYNIVGGIDNYHHQSSIDSSDNTIINLSPEYISEGNKWKARLGANVFADFYNQNKFYFYPNIYGQYNIVEDILIPYIGLEGRLKKNSYKTLSNLNPFILSTAILQNSDYSYQLYGGVRGSLSSSISFNTKITYNRINSMPFFINNLTSQYNTFAVVYDDVNLLNVHGELGYQKLEKLRVSLKGDYYHYEMTNEKQPWHTPKFSFALAANYNISDKIIAKADVFIIGKQPVTDHQSIVDIHGISTSTQYIKELDGIVDINLGGEYRYTKRLSAFINFNNLGVFRYSRWNNYPSQSFNFLAGLSYAF